MVLLSELFLKILVGPKMNKYKSPIGLKQGKPWSKAREILPEKVGGVVRPASRNPYLPSDLTLIRRPAVAAHTQLG